ncbi:hypothetical protein V6U89_20445 [Micromonospora sp. CPCC 206171]|uniref:hypothetical protein n=1 Tax=Micromonospora sp. CPCC 206171 TaxID=3122405 RepID=UPI002FF2CB60
MLDGPGEAYPAGLEELLVAVSEEYAPARIMVTESGAAWPDRVTARRRASAACRWTAASSGPC